MKLISKFIFSACAVTALMPTSTLASDGSPQGYLVDAAGNVVTSATSGLCWHTGDWTPALAIQKCDPSIRPIAEAPRPRPAEIIAAAPPAPLIVPAPARSLPHKMSFSAEALFAFDKSELKPEGKVMLDDLVQQLKGASYDIIEVTGHADRFGSPAYNQKLSERRANGVKDYLVSKNIAARQITATGHGETHPLTKADDCKGAKSDKVIACLQPDRRVDVKMKGTKP